MPGGNAGDLSFLAGEIKAFEVPAWLLGIAMAVGEARAHAENDNCPAAGESLHRAAVMIDQAAAMIHYCEAQRSEVAS